MTPTATSPALLSLGTAINSATPLQAVSLADVAGRIRTCAALQGQTARLRRLVAFDRDAYRVAKTSLPFVVGSGFAHGVRRLDALEAAHFFVLDLDHCTGLEAGLPDAIRADWSVALAFVSPSGEGLKVLCPLLNPCPDARVFSVAYRAFASDFAARHGFVKSIDLRTADATRACFLAHDPAVYHNPDAMPVDWRLWADPETPAGNVPDDVPTPARKPAAERPIDEASLADLRRAINPNTPTRRPKQTYVPAELTAVEPDVRRLCEAMGWELAEVQPLNYGLKFTAKHGHRRAEVCVYGGKRGFSVVISPKTGADPTLANWLHAKLYRLLLPAPVAEHVPVALSMN